MIIEPELLLNAYCQGVFPMAGDDGEIRWYRPDPRCIFDLATFHAGKRLMRSYRKGVYSITIDRNFEEVMRACADRETTWIDENIVQAYCRLHEAGYAHSVEAYHEGELVGGLYGVALGGAFMGESMFFRMTDASKLCLVYLVERMKARGYVLLDTQFTNDHLAQFNPTLISRAQYEARLQEALKLDCDFA
jgi:leucyl/phenylalanyl-tRNA--protein transferase